MWEASRVALMVERMGYQMVDVKAAWTVVDSVKSLAASSVSSMADLSASLLVE